jgi:hypothetical protein
MSELLGFGLQLTVAGSMQLAAAITTGNRSSSSRPACVATLRIVADTPPVRTAAGAAVPPPPPAATEFRKTLGRGVTCTGNGVSVFCCLRRLQYKSGRSRGNSTNIAFQTADLERAQGSPSLARVPDVLEVLRSVRAGHLAQDFYAAWVVVGVACYVVDCTEVCV